MGKFGTRDFSPFEIARPAAQFPFRALEVNLKWLVKSFSLPLKLTKHAKGGSKSVSYLDRSLPKWHGLEQLTSDVSPEIKSEGFEVCETNVVKDSSTYLLEVKSTVKDWEQVRKQLLNATIEGAGVKVRLMVVILVDMSTSRSVRK